MFLYNFRGLILLFTSGAIVLLFTSYLDISLGFSKFMLFPFFLSSIVALFYDKTLGEGIFKPYWHNTLQFLTGLYNPNSLPSDYEYNPERRTLFCGLPLGMSPLIHLIASLLAFIFDASLSNFTMAPPSKHIENLIISLILTIINLSLNFATRNIRKINDYSYHNYYK